MGLFDFFKKKNDMGGAIQDYSNNNSNDTLFESNFNKSEIDFDETTVSFYMVVEDCFSITGRGTVVTGKVSKGEVHVGDDVNIRRVDNSVTQCRIIGIEQFRKLIDYAREGDNVGLLLSNIKRADVERGWIIFK